MQTQRKEKSKSDVFKETTTNYDVPSRRVCAVTSFECFVRNQPVFRSVVVCFRLSGRVLLFFIWLNFFFFYCCKGAPQRGARWRHFATTRAEGRGLVCSYRSMGGTHVVKSQVKDQCNSEFKSHSTS